jgi:hypothetical protein
MMMMNSARVATGNNKPSHDFGLSRRGRVMIALRDSGLLIKSRVMMTTSAVMSYRAFDEEQERRRRVCSSSSTHHHSFDNSNNNNKRMIITGRRGSQSSNKPMNAIHDAVNDAKKETDLRKSLHELGKKQQQQQQQQLKQQPKDEQRRSLEHLLECVDADDSLSFFDDDADDESTRSSNSRKEEEEEGEEEEENGDDITFNNVLSSSTSSSSTTIRTTDVKTWNQAAAAAAAYKGIPGFMQRQVIYCGTDGGFVVGHEKPRKHVCDCRCPNCNFLRKRMIEGSGAREGEIIVKVLEEEGVLEMVGSDPEAVLNPETTIANEMKRRERISISNKGNVPWNKGRKHSEETIQKIREKTMERMQAPEVRDKIRKAALLNAHNVTPQTKWRISLSVRDAMKKKKISNIVKQGIRTQPNKSKVGLASFGCFAKRSSSVGCVYFGITDERERIRNELKKKRQERLERKEEKMKATKERQNEAKLLRQEQDEKNGNKMKRKYLNQKERTPEHNAKIAQAIKKLWEDPVYANKLKSVERGTRENAMFGVPQTDSQVRRERAERNRKKKLSHLSQLLTEIDNKKIQSEELLSQMEIAHDVAKVAVYSFEQKLANGSKVADFDFDREAYEKATLAKRKTKDMISALCASISALDAKFSEIEEDFQKIKTKEVPLRIPKEAKRRQSKTSEKLKLALEKHKNKIGLDDDDDANLEEV